MFKDVKHVQTELKQILEHFIEDKYTKLYNEL